MRKRRDKDFEDLIDQPALWAEFRTSMVGALVAASGPAIEESIALAVEAGVGIEIAIVNEAVAAFIESYADEWWTAIETTTRESMRDAFRLFAEGEIGTREELLARLETLFSPERAQMIAATETTRMFSLSNVTSYTAAGIERVRFLTVRDQFVDGECSQYDSLVFPVDEAPTPPLHVNCRCFLAPVVA